MIERHAWAPAGGVQKGVFAPLRPYQQMPPTQATPALVLPQAAVRHKFAPLETKSCQYAWSHDVHINLSLASITRAFPTNLVRQITNQQQIPNDEVYNKLYTLSFALGNDLNC